MILTADGPMTYEPKDVVDFHGALAGEWEQRYLKNSFRARIEVLQEGLKDCALAGRSWLDAGCGTGTLSRFLADKGCSVLGVDAALPMIEVARQQGARHSQANKMKFEVLATIEQLPNASASLDGILCSSVLEYVPDVERCLAEFARVLKPDGLTVISVPNAQSLVRKSQVSAHHWGRRLGRRWLDFVQYSRNEYSTAEFTDLLGTHGFEVRRVLVFGSPLPRWVQRRRFGGSLLLFVAVRSNSSAE